MHDVIIIGAGHNALAAAFYLARAGRKPLVLERREIVGGCATTEEFAPGFRSPMVAHTLGPLRPSIVRDMQLARRGVRFVDSDPRLVALDTDGRAIVFSADAARTVEAIRPFSSKDAARYPEFCATLERLGSFLARFLERTPPSISSPAAGDLWELLKAGRRFRALGRRDMFSLLRWVPMAVADLVGESLETDLLQAAVAAPAIRGAAMGPWSAGTGAILLLAAAIDPAPGGSSVTAIGGPGAVTQAMADAAREAGAVIRTSAEVCRILIKDGGIAGVALHDGTEIAAETVISGADPKRTFLRLIDPIELEPGFISRIRNYRMPGVVAKVNLALGAIPAFRGISGDLARTLAGRIHIGPGIDYLERAFDASKYGEISPSPYLDITFPSLIDPSLAPAGRHVMSIHVQYAPKLLRGRTWADERNTLLATVVRTLTEYAPAIGDLIEHAHVLTPDDLENVYGLTCGHIHHGELALDQVFTMRPTLGWADYRTPIEGLFLCGAGTHPGMGVTGGSGQNAARKILKMHRGVTSGRAGGSNRA